MTTTTGRDPLDFRGRLRARDQIFGTFLKLPTTQVIEILGVVGYDFVIIDQEHAPLDRGVTDLMILAARACGMAPVVRVGEFSEAAILSALDSGACGVMVPHVDSVEKAKRIAASCRYAGGTRGFAGMSRAANWGALSQNEHLKRQDAQVACIAMIEDQHAIPLTAEIAAVEGIDAVFVGQGDLTASFGEDPDAKSKVAAIVDQVAAALKTVDKPLMMIPNGPSGVAKARDLGAAALILSSDHGFIKTAAASALKAHQEG